MEVLEILFTVNFWAAAVRIATVALGMTASDVVRLFRSKTDHAEKDRVILLDASDNRARYLLIFDTPDDNRTDAKPAGLSQVVVWPGGTAKSLFVLPRQKRGSPVPEEYQAILQDRSSDR